MARFPKANADLASTLAILNHPPTRLPGSQLLQELVQKNGSQGNAAIDFIAPDGRKESMSYGDFHRRSDALAITISRLTQSGPQNEQSVVPVLVPQQPGLYVALLAILKAGGAFCPLNLDAPPDRVKFILQDVAAKVVITTRELAAAIPQDEAYTVVLLEDVARDESSSGTPGHRHRQAQPSDLAYVMYTSGSTGTPKGVGVSHDAATQSLLAHDRHIPHFSRFLQFAAPTFDVSVFEIFFPFLRGSTLVSCHRAVMLEDLPGVVRAMEVDACELTPTVAGSLLRKRENAPCLKLLLTIGEMLTEPVVREFGGTDEIESMLWAMYGPTEATIHCTLQPAFASESPVANIGIPLDTVSAFIIRTQDNPIENKDIDVLHIGEVGELAVGGYQLASGYLNRPEQTANSFVDSPYGPLYRTGDKARILPNGTLECLGRIGNGQVKLRGQRLELGEVEQAALRTPGCHGAVAAVIGNILVLFCAVDVVESGVNTVSSTEETCKRWLPGFMVPGDIITMQDFPKLPSGKVDRKRLVSEYNLRNDHDPQAKPDYRDDLEQQLCKVASSLLGCAVQASTNLAVAGLDSLLAIRLASSLRQVGVETAAMDVLRSRTVSDLYSFVSRHQKGTGGRSAAPDGQPSLDESVPNRTESIRLPQKKLLDNVEAIQPCTPLQSSMLAETMSHPGAYCNWVELSLPGRHDEMTIRSWMVELITRNQILRTSFVYHRDRFIQLTRSDNATHVPIQVLSSLKHLSRDFSMSSEEDFLCPLRVQICVSAFESRIVLQIHHALYDGWTTDLIVRDLNKLARGEELEERPPFQRVVDHTLSRQKSNGSDASKGFWAEYLAAFQPVAFPQLLASMPRPGKTETRTLRMEVQPEEAKRALQKLECSPQVLFQASLAWLWSCYAGHDDVVVGFVTSGRTIPVSQIEDIMGPCIATLPSRTNISQVRTAGDLLRSMQVGNRAMLDHSSLPLAEIKKAAGILPGQSVYDVLFVYQESLFSAATANRESAAVREVAHQDYLETKLLVEVEPQQGYYECRFTYHTDSLSEELALTLGEQLQVVAQHILADCDVEMSSLRSVFPDRLLSTHNLQSRTLSGTPDLAKNVEAVVTRSPDSVAVCFARTITDHDVDAESLTYRQLNSLANKIARKIRGSGCLTGDVVAIVMEKSALLYAGILAIVKAGCSYLPLLPTTPRARIEVILTQADVKLCLTDTFSFENIPQRAAMEILDLNRSSFGHLDGMNLDIPADPARIANIVYTSGSTGVPKGVCVTQLNITSNLEVLSRIYPVKGDSALLQSCSQAFDVSVFEIFFAWTQGMRLCSASNDTLFEDLERSIRRLGVTHLSMTPTVASLVNPKNVPNVGFLVTSGEAMSDKVAKSWGRLLYQGYGPSETTNICTVKKMGLIDNEIIQHLGFALENTSTVVLHRDSTDAVPRGCVGELCFGGDQVAQGYLEMPELTETKFINHPRYGRLYRSGDLGKMLPDGSLVIIGRVDDQVKLRGQRIELSEINTVAKEVPDVSECVTMLLKRHDSSSDQLVFFYVSGDAGASSLLPIKILVLDDQIKRIAASIHQLLSAKVPIYMVPSYFVPLSKIPVTASGKLDRAWLRNIFQQLDQSYLEGVSAKAETTHVDGEWTDLDKKIANITSLCLSVPQGGLTKWTPLVSVGLDSISAIGLSKELQKQLGCRVPVSTVLQNSSIARLADAVERASSSSTLNGHRTTLDIFSGQLLKTIKSKYNEAGHTVEKVLPCTPLQEAMLAASATGKSYINTMLFRVTGDPEKLKKCWLIMCERHPTLRTCFASTESHQHAFAQVVVSDWRPEWVNFTETDGSLDHCISRHLDSVGQAVDSMTPPLSFAFIRQAAELYFSFVCHHALYDGIAIERLLFEVEQLANGVRLEPPPSVEPFLEEMLAELSSSDDFWKEQLRDYTPTLLPQPKSISLTSVKTHGIHEFSVNIPLSIIQERSKASGWSLLSFCQATWASVLSYILQVDDICFGNVMSCRSAAIERVDELVAPCFNTIPVRMNLSALSQNRDLVRAFNTLNPKLLQHQFASLRRIQPLLSSSRHGSRPLFDTLLLLQHPARVLDDRLWTLERDDGEMDIPLVCEFTPNIEKSELAVKLHYDYSIVSTPMIEVISEILQHCISYMINYPSSQIPTSSTLPSNPAGKLSDLVIRRTLQTTGRETISNGNNERWSAEELRIRQVLAKLSSVSEQTIRRHTTIYQLGLDSISAVQISSLLKREGMAISASDVIELNTCAKLAQKAPTKPAFPITNGVHPPDFSGFQLETRAQLREYHVAEDSVENVFPCTSLQTGMLVHFLQSRGQDYFNYIDFELNGELDFKDMRSAWVTLSTAHPMLRTGFVPVQSRDFSFAMVQYRPSTVTVPIAEPQGEQTLKFNIEEWRLDTAGDALNRLQYPPWRAVFVEQSGKRIMYLAIHHALYDAQSLRTLLQDLSRLLRGEAIAGTSSIEDAVQDIVSRERDLESREAFWKPKSNEVVINFFPTLTPLREETRAILVDSIVGGHKFSQYEKALSNAGFTMQAAVQAAWTRILGSYLGETSVTFGVVLSGRNSEATNDAVFPCISTLPVISSTMPSNMELLQSMLDYSSQLYKQQHTPLTKIQRWLGYPDTRLFDTLLVYQKVTADSEAPLPWKVMQDHATVNYPISIEVEPSQDDKLLLRITFFSDVIPQEHARLLLKQFDAVLSHLALHPDEQETDLLSISPGLFSVTPPEEPELVSPEQFLHQFVESQALKTPAKTALQFVERLDGTEAIGDTWSYKDLDKRGNQVARMLSPHAKTGDIVAVYFDKCPEVFFAILGILKAGCAFVALDPTAPPSRKEFILKDSGASVLLTSTQTASALDISTEVTVLSIDETFLSQVDSSPVVLNKALTPQDICYCLYTSGTTGTPKGCEITHENAVQAMLAFQVLFAGHWEETSRWLQFASFHFDVSVLEQYWSWSIGITLVAAPRDLILEDLVGTISRLEITHIDLTPSLARLLHPDDVPSLTRGVFITGGEQLKQEILDVWGSKGVIYNAYGPTEATIGVTTYPRVPRNGRSSNIGKQFVNVGSYVLKPGTDTPVLRGGVGELCVSGKLVGKGYLGRPDLTTERFPTLKNFNERVYRTGDLVRILHDGCFDFLGRADDQVKLRGQRLELGEINHTIRTAVEDVTDVATLMIRNEKLQKDTLVSFVVTKGRPSKNTPETLEILADASASTLSKQVQDACRAKLPGYMVPTHVFSLPYIPLSSNNKAETRKLKALVDDLSQKQLVTLSSHGSGAAAQLDEIGHELVRILFTVERFDMTQVNAGTSIFELGVDSISVMRFTTALKRAGFGQASPALILKNSRLSDLAVALSTKSTLVLQDNTTATRQLVQACYHRYLALVLRETQLDAQNIEYIAPCSPLQEGMLTRSKMPGKEGAYFNVFRYELSENVSLSRLKQAWKTVVKLYPVLRTKFVETDDGHIQVASKMISLPWEEHMAESKKRETFLGNQLDSWVARNASHVLEPLHLLVVNFDDGTRVFAVHIFHGLYDGNSMDLMMQKFQDIYSQQQPQPSVAPSFLEALIHGPLRNYTTSKDFWVGHLAESSYRTLHPISNQPSLVDIECTRRVSLVGLDKLSISLGVTHQAIIQAAWISVIQQYLEIITIGMIVSGRSIDLLGVDEIIGPLFNTIPFHAVLSENETWASLIRKCHDSNVAILPFQHVPLRDVQKWCSDGQPLFDTLFSFQRAQSSADQNLWRVLDSPPNADFPLAFEATLVEDDQLQLQLVAQGGIADHDSLSHVLDQVESALQAVLSPEQPVRRQPRRQVNGFTTQNAARSMSLSPASATFEWTETARLVQQEIAQLANVPVESVGETASLLEFGLDSIDMIKLSSRLRKRGIKIATSQLMKAQRLSAIVNRVQPDEQRSKMQANGHGPPKIFSQLKDYLQRTGESLDKYIDVLPVTPLQDSLVAEMIQSDFHLYFNHDVLELDPAVDMDRLRQAWEVVIENTPILCTTFVEVEDASIDAAYCQIVNKPARRAFLDINLEAQDGFDQVTEAARQRAVDGKGRSNLLQLALVRRSHRHYLVLSIAHALYDGWSLSLLHQDVWTAYHGSFRPRPNYKIYLQQLVETSPSEAKRFWSGYLAGSNSTMVPKQLIDEPRPQTTHRMEAHSSISPGQLKAFCKHHAISSQILGQACWAVLLASLTRSLDVTFGVVLSGRDTEEAQQLMFPTMNTVAVRSVLHGNVRSWLLYMQENMNGIRTYQHFPLREAQRVDNGRNGPLFNSLFIQQVAQETESSGQKPLAVSIEGSSAVEYPVCVEIEITPELVLWRTACDSTYFSSDETDVLLHQLDDVLHFLVDSPTADILAFTGQEVSVCGLSPFTVRGKEHPKMETVTTNGFTKPSVSSDAENSICAVLSEVSGVPTSSIDQSHSIYHLGLDSISIIKVSSILRKKGIILPARQMLGATSIMDMAAMASSSTTTNSGVKVQQDTIALALQDINSAALLSSAGILTESVESVLPATAMQVHMLSAWQNTSGAIFHPEFSFTLMRVKKLDVIISAWISLLHRHSILRTSFLATEARNMPFIKVIHRFRPGLASNTVEDGTLMSKVSASSETEPLVSLRVTSRAPDSGAWLVKLKIHHALYDGVSLPIIMDTFRQLCHGRTASSADIDLEQWKKLLSLQFATETKTTRQTFWRSYLQGAKPPFFTSQPSPPTPGSPRISLLKRSAVPNISHLQSLSTKSGISLQALFFAAYARFLASGTAAEDVIFGIYLSNRTSEETQALAYPTLCLVPLRVRRALTSDIITLARQIRQDIHAISSPVNVSVGLWEILDWTGVRIDSFVNFLSMPDDGANTGGEKEREQEVNNDEFPVEHEKKRDLASFLEANPFLKSNCVRNVYPDAVDVEVSVVKNAMDIGVFGPGSMISPSGAEEIVSTIVQILEAKE